MTETTTDMTTFDPRPTFAEAVATARGVFAAVTPGDLVRPTPCSEFDVEHLLGHMTMVLRRATALGAGTDPFAMPDVLTGVAADGWVAALDTEAEQAQRVWSDDAVLDRLMVLPWAQKPGREVLATYTAELTAHTWDLARSLEVDVAWDADTIEVADAAARELLPPAPRAEVVLPNGMRAPFDEPVEIGSQAEPIDSFVAWYGRDPKWAA